MEYLVETALLTHGLKSITNEKIRAVWQSDHKNIVWVSKGKIVIGNIEEYLSFRQNIDQLTRINASRLECALEQKKSGALTASGTMKVCEREGISLAVTCGMGGIGDINGGELCPDLSVLAESKLALLTAGPKDMLFRQKTIEWMIDHGIRVVGSHREFYTGYIFCGEEVKMQGVYRPEDMKQRPLLIVNEIPEEHRVLDYGILEEAIKEGKRAEAEGRYYHPVVNGKIDELTHGHSSEIQLIGLWENTRMAESLEDR